MAVVLDGSEVEVLGLAAGESRQVIATSGDGEDTATTLVRADGPTPLTIRFK